MSRKFLRPIKRVVIKVGSSTIASDNMKPRAALLRSLARQIGVLNQGHIEVILVSSGAIVLGMGELDSRVRPKDLASLQALAAIGQTALMRKYSDLFKRQGITCAQVLLTWDDFADRQRFNNARNTLRAILDRGVVPIVNENDTISTDEIRFGDNDKLSAFVASLVGADLLLLLSDVEGLYQIQDGRKKVFEEIKEITAEIQGVAGGTAKKNLGKGGMSAKLAAVQIATHANVPCVIANGRARDVITRVITGERLGTYFVEKEEHLLARKHWISFGAKPKGVLIIDDGAKAALLKGGRSLLLPGLLKWEGHFKAEDVVVVCGRDRQEFARGIVAYSDSQLFQAVPPQSGREAQRGQRAVIHCDNLVFCQR